MRQIIAILLFLCTIQLFGQGLKGNIEKKPNVIVIMVDDLSVADISLNKQSLISTPNIDRLAKEGVNFSDAYVSSPVCSPSRASFITGKYAQRFGFQFQMHDRYPKGHLEYLGFKLLKKTDPWVPKKIKNIPTEEEIAMQGLPASEQTLPQLLKGAGYKTGLVGKWHLGWHSSNVPCNFGFDFQYGFYGSHSLYVEEETIGYVDQKVKQDFTDKFIWKGQREGPHAIYRNCEPITETGYLTDRITQESIQFMQNQKEEPFFLWVSYNAPHTPFQCKQAHYDALTNIEDPIKRVYNAMILSLDENIGHLLDAVQRLGLEENTMIVFLSDNGGAEYTLATENGDYKGGKITDLEGGLKVPMFIKWKHHIPEGTVFANPVIAMDLFATIMAATGTALPTNSTVDGVDLLPFIREEKADAPHEFLYWQRGVSRAIRSVHYKVLVNDMLQDTVLFDLQKDPFETENIYSSHQTEATSLVGELNKWSAGLPQPLWPAVIYYEFKNGEQRYLFDQ